MENGGHYLSMCRQLITSMIHRIASLMSLKWIATLVLLCIVGLVFFYGYTSPVNDVTGCYRYALNHGYDQVCLEHSGRYKQGLVIKNVENTYNEGTWRSFTYTNDNESLTGVVLDKWLALSEENVSKSNNKIDLDIQPYQNMFGKVIFRIGSNITGKERFYIQQ